MVDPTVKNEQTVWEVLIFLLFGRLRFLRLSPGCLFYLFKYGNFKKIDRNEQLQREMKPLKSQPTLAMNAFLLPKLSIKCLFNLT